MKSATPAERIILVIISLVAGTSLAATFFALFLPALGNNVFLAWAVLVLLAGVFAWLSYCAQTVCLEKGWFVQSRKIILV